MNLGTITTTNTKGQFVIPKHLRTALGITPRTPLHVVLRDQSITIEPVEAIIAKNSQLNNYLEILKKTAGSWTDNDWPKTEKKLKRLELEKAQEARKAW